VIASKYGVDNLGRWSKKSSYAHGVGCWKSILVGLELFKTLVHFKSGMGLGSYFDGMCGVVIVFLRLNFLIYLEWLNSKMRLCIKCFLGMGS